MIRVLVLQALLAQSALPPAEGDWFASLYTADGLELRADDRVFTLFAVFNALGLDRGAIARTEPVPRMTYPEVRQLVRARVMGAAPEVRRAADAFFDAHPVALTKYLASALATGFPPFDRVKVVVGELKGLEQVLAQAWAGWKLEELSLGAQASQRQALKAWLPLLDRPIGRAKEALKRPDAEVVVIANLLDEPDTARAVPGPSGRIYLVVGPTQRPDVELLVGALARFFIEPVVARQVGQWALGGATLKEARAAGARETSVEELATHALSAAVALRSVEAPETRWDTVTSGGYFGIRDAARLLDDAKPLDGWALDAMHKLETRRPAKK